MLKIYNTLTRTKEEFKPIVPGEIHMYVCGPTVYNYIHIGNARSAIAFDTIRRYFEYRGYKVTYVSNFTDVDDKIINRAHEEGVEPLDLAQTYIDAFMEDTKAVGIEPATVNPRASEMIPDIIEFIQDLIAKGYAYASDGDVYFRARKAKNYGAWQTKTLMNWNKVQVNTWRMLKPRARKIQLISHCGRKLSPAKSTGTHHSVLVGLAGTSNVQ